MKLIVPIVITSIFGFYGCSNNNPASAPLYLHDTLVVADTIPASSVPVSFSVHEGNILADQIWSPAQNPHLIKGAIAVDSHAVLTLLPGTVVKFEQNGLLTIKSGSRLQAVGNVNDSILLTSALASPYYGCWRGIRISPIFGTPIRYDSLQYLRIEFAGTADSGAIKVSRPIFIAHSNIQFSNGCGIYFYDSTARPVGFDSNLISNNRANPLWLDYGAAHLLSNTNTFTANGDNSVKLMGEDVTMYTPLHLSKLSVAYIWSVNHLRLEADLIVDPGTTLRMAAGVEIEASNGKVSAVGTEADSIFFISDSPSPGFSDWFGITISTSSGGAKSIFKYCRFSNASKAIYIENVVNDYGYPVIEKTTFDGNRSGVWMFIDGPSIKDEYLQQNTFLNNLYDITAN